MFCRYCGTQIPDRSPFCDSCGRQLYPPVIAAPPQPLKPKKKKEDRALILAIIGMIVALLLLIGAILFFLLRNDAPDEPREATQPSTSEEQESTKPASSTTEPVSETETISEVPTESESETTSVPTETERETSGFGEYVHSGDYILPDSNSRMLTEDDIVGMSERDLQMAVNEIFARHGRKFTTPEIRDYFESKSWYHATTEPEDFSDWVFNEFEKANLDFLLAAAEERD